MSFWMTSRVLVGSLRAHSRHGMLKISVKEPFLRQQQHHKNLFTSSSPVFASTKDLPPPKVKRTRPSAAAASASASVKEDFSTKPLEHTFETLSLESFSSLYATKPANRTKIKHILNLYEHEKYTGTSEVPTTLTLSEMSDLLTVFPDEKELKRQLKFFFKRECARHNSAIKKAARKVTILENKMDKFKINDIAQLNDWEAGIFNSSGQLVYGLWHNSLLSRISKQAVRDYRHRVQLRHSAMFGQKLIIDLDYDQYMKLYESRLLASQIGILYYENLINRDAPEVLPFDVHFTNCSKGNKTLEAVSKQLKRMDQMKEYFHEGSYLDYPELFPRKRLVYLSPHARESITRYSHDDIYILGGYNDKTSKMKISHVKAEQEGIECYRLPLDENVLWKQGSRNLCLNQVAAILHTVKATGNWKEAIHKWAPQRKIKSTDELMLEDELRAKRTERRLKSIQKSFNIEAAGKIFKL